MRGHFRQDSRACTPWKKCGGVRQRPFSTYTCVQAAHLPVVFSCVVRLFLCALWMSELALRGVRAASPHPGSRASLTRSVRSGSAVPLPSRCSVHGTEKGSVLGVCCVRRPSEMCRIGSHDMDPGLPLPTPDFFIVPPNFIMAEVGYQIR